MDIQQVKQMAANGMTRIQIATATGKSYSYVTTFCNENGIKVVRKKTVQPKRGPKEQDPFYKERDVLIADYRQQGMKQSAIAKLLGCSLDVVKNTCRKLKITVKQESVTEEQAAEIVSKAGYDYISGFENTHSKIRVRCKVCGYESDRMYHIFRKYVDGVYPSELECSGCIKIKAEARKEQEQQYKAIKQQLNEQNRLIKLSLKINESLLYRMESRTCKNCGQSYCIQSTGYDSTIYCSEKCCKRWLNRNNKDKRIKRMKSKKHDDITLDRLYTIENGICYLCGTRCNWEDIIEQDGTMIAGNSYPSIDHVKPLVKGGTHTWDNVRLACRICNSIKSAS